MWRQPGTDTLPPFLMDVHMGSGRAKDTGHPWEQSVGEARALIQNLTAVDALVVDPFVGSGTVALAAYQAGRRCIAADISEEYVGMAGARLAQAATEAESNAPGRAQSDADPGRD